MYDILWYFALFLAHLKLFWCWVWSKQCQNSRWSFLQMTRVESSLCKWHHYLQQSFMYAFILLHYHNKPAEHARSRGPVWPYLCFLSFSSFPSLVSGQSQHRSHQKGHSQSLRLEKDWVRLSLFLVLLFHLLSSCFVIHDGKYN